MRLIQKAFTFDDVLLVPAHSTVLPREVSLRSRLTRNVQLNIPLVSAAMDTVTESRLAIALAQEGGVGIVHKNMPPRTQAAEVAKVKRYESGVLRDPMTVSPDITVRELLKLTQQHKVSGFPVVEKGRVVGMVTNRDYRFETNLDAPVRAIMTPRERLIYVKETASPDEAKALLHKHRLERVLVVDDGFELRGLITVKDILKSTEYPNACRDQHGKLRVGAAIGVGDGTEERAELLVRAGVDVIVVDTAHGHSAGVVERVRWVKRNFPTVDVIGGNIATGQAALDLVKAGADTVMMGGAFAGTEEAPGEVILFQGRTYKSYRGMGSIGAMQQGSADRYFQEGEASAAGSVGGAKLVPEGIEGQVPYKGSVVGIIFQMAGGLRASMHYCGCASIAEMHAKSEFVEITSSGVRESHVHDVQITKEAPNYRAE
jgi:IMP dehydrogenase